MGCTAKNRLAQEEQLKRQEGFPYPLLFEL